MSAGLEAHGVSADAAHQSRRCRRSRSCSPRSSATTRSSTCSARTCSPALLGARPRGADRPPFFPTLISAPFRDGLHAAFLFAIVACLIAAAASLMRGGRMVDGEEEERAAAPPPTLTAAEI